ncbi:MAG: right-handed parallel beta-helix repeat-containing protein [Planctomycetota bacterium]|nr:right-handed parallel beta-helix repeat-containing protein [Planctomycetota bacterium]
MATCILLAGTATADTLEVPGNYPTINDAVLAANAGDTISIAAGTYPESNIFIQSPDITITGAVNSDGSPAVKIDGEESNDILIAIGVVGATGATVENIIFTGSTANAVWIYHHSPTIRNCVFAENSTEFQGGAVWSSNTEARFESCRFVNNSGGTNGSAVFTKGTTGLRGTTGPTFQDCHFEGNEAYATVLVQFRDAHFEQCTFQGNSGPTTLAVFSGTAVVSNSLFCENQSDPITGPWNDDGGNEFHDVCPSDCIGDLNGDQTVGVDDLLALLDAFQVNDDGDCDGDGDTDVNDLLLLIGYYGATCS